MNGDHYAPPMREPVLAPLPSAALTQTEQRVTDAFFHGIPPMICHGGKYLRGEVTLDVQYYGHRQQVTGRTLIEALANVQTLYTDIHVSTREEAA